ncbi:response regulator transcription factor [Laribacter hongkongensis]|nr:response regulator transcription factor [Laribacter hongkongensis]MCG9096181.1 response regulator transcription factor [Laribacter hongkongensis]
MTDPLLLLEDELELQDELSCFLLARGWNVLAASTIAEAMSLIDRVQMAICDVMLPDGSGFDFVSSLREHSARCGIVMLTARSGTHDIVTGLHGGADHYLVKPVNLLQLDATLHALARRALRHCWVLEKAALALRSPDGVILELSTGEWQLLSVLAAARGNAVSRKDIVQAQGHEWLEFDQRRLDTQVSRLRQRWRLVAGHELPLKTAHRSGYVLTVAVELA